MQHNYAYTPFTPSHQSQRPANRRSKFLVTVFLVMVVAAISVYGTKHSKAIEPAKKVSSNSALTKSWQTILAGAQGSVAIAVYNHKTGQTTQISNRDNATFNTASIVKLSILEDLLLHDQQQGTSLTSGQLAQAQPMIENSDNDAATALWHLDGGTTGLDSFFKTIGATATSAGQDDYWGLTQTTALDQLKVVNQIAYPKLLSTASVDAATKLLSNVESDQRWGVSGGVPSGVSVQLKNGWLQGADNDPNTWDVNSIGYVNGDGQDYTIAVLTSGNATEQSGIDTIQGLAAATWKDLSATLK